MPAKHSTYTSYLVRLWWNESQSLETQTDGTESPASEAQVQRDWWMTALDPQTGEQWGFVDLGQVIAFFQEQIRMHLDLNPNKSAALGNPESPADSECGVDSTPYNTSGGV